MAIAKNGLAGLTPGSARRIVGRQYAVDHLKRLGYDVLDVAAPTRFGHCDIVAKDGDTLVFVSVDVNANLNAAFKACDFQKRENVRRVAASYLSNADGRHHFAESVRFDMIGVELDANSQLVWLEQIEGAF